MRNRLIIIAVALCILLAVVSYASADQPLITITPKQGTVNIGDEAIFQYKIQNYNQFVSAEVGLGIFYTGYMEDPVYSDFDEDSFMPLAAGSGSFSYQVEYGFGICAQIRITDGTGTVHTGYSTIVTVYGYDPDEPQILITPRSALADVGDTVYFDYEVLDIYEFQSLKARIGICTDPELIYYDDFGPWIDIPGDSTYGWVEYKVTSGSGIAVEFQLTDMSGQTWSFLSETIPVASPTLILPEGLKRIETNAFAGDMPFEAVRIPANVSFIADDAFGNREQLIIYGTPGTEAEAFANRHEGYTFITVK